MGGTFTAVSYILGISRVRVGGRATPEYILGVGESRDPFDPRPITFQHRSTITNEKPKFQGHPLSAKTSFALT